MRPVTQCKWHLLKEQARRLVILKSSASSRARLTEVLQQPEARRPQNYNFGKASVSGHHPHSDEKRHTPFLYFINYPKSKQQNALLVLKPTQKHAADLLQPCGAAECSLSTQERHRPFSPKTWSVLLFNFGGYRHTPPRSGWRGRELLPQGFAVQALCWPHSTISWGKKSWFSPEPSQCPLIWSKNSAHAHLGLAQPNRNSWQRTSRLACPGIIKFIFKSCYIQSSWALRGLPSTVFSTREHRKAWKYYHQVLLGKKKN